MQCINFSDDFVSSSRIIKSLGQGVYGSVNLVKNGGKKYAVKKQVLIGRTHKGSLLSISALREIDFLSKFNDQEGIIKMFGVCSEIYTNLILEPMVIDLYNFVLNTSYSEREYLYDRLRVSMLTAIDMIAQYGYIHGDIKPANILMDAKLNFKLADFGLLINRYIIHDSLPMYTAQFRPPEYILFGIDRTKINDGVSDVWALGATLYYFKNEKYVIEIEDDSTDEVTAGLLKIADKTSPVDIVRKINSGKYSQYIKNEFTDPIISEMLQINPFQRRSPSEILELSQELSFDGFDDKTIIFPYFEELNNLLENADLGQLFKYMTMDMFHRVDEIRQEDIPYFLAIAVSYFENDFVLENFFKLAGIDIPSTTSKQAPTKSILKGSTPEMTFIAEKIAHCLKKIKYIVFSFELGEFLKMYPESRREMILPDDILLLPVNDWGTYIA